MRRLGVAAAAAVATNTGGSSTVNQSNSPAPLFSRPETWEIILVSGGVALILALYFGFGGYKGDVGS